MLNKRWIKHSYARFSSVVFCSFFQSERREKHEKENALTLADEVDRVNMEVEQEKAELQVRSKQIKIK